MRPVRCVTNCDDAAYWSCSSQLISTILHFSAAKIEMNASQLHRRQAQPNPTQASALTDRRWWRCDWPSSLKFDQPARDPFPTREPLCPKEQSWALANARMNGWMTAERLEIAVAVREHRRAHSIAEWHLRAVTDGPCLVGDAHAFEHEDEIVPPVPAPTNAAGIRCTMLQRGALCCDVYCGKPNHDSNIAT